MKKRETHKDRKQERENTKRIGKNERDKTTKSTTTYLQKYFIS